MTNNYLAFPFFRSSLWRAHAWRTRLSLLLVIMIGVCAAIFWLYRPIGAQPGTNCSANFFIDKTLSNGARWQLCWEHRSLDGIVLRDIYFTPPGGLGRRVLAQGSISQVHVPYDDNSARFHDITDDGFGDNNLNNLTAAECPAGVLLQLGTKNALCQQIQLRSYAFKGLGLQEQGEWLSLFSVSTSGEYNYIPVWRFLDDGTIELLMGATGKLQRFTTDSRYGWPVRTTGTLGTSHIHNYYWRLDFDLGESGDNDLVEEFNYTASADNTRRTLGVSRLTTEAGRSIDPVNLRSWRIRDGATTNANGQFISYQLEPIDVGHRDVGPTYEPWTANDFYVTKYRECERYVSHNPQVSGCANNLTGFVNGENVENADVVLWYGVTFHHIPRDEDEPYMHAHWNGFRLTPRDWMATNPAAADVVTCGVGDVTCDAQTNAADALFMLQYDVRLRTSSAQLPLPDGTLYGYACDVSGEGACNAIDALLTLQCSIGLTNKFCPGMDGIQAAQSTSDSVAPVVVTVDKANSESSGKRRTRVNIDTPTRVGAASVVLHYDPTWPGAVTCQSDPAVQFELDTCRVDPEAGVVRFSMVSPAGHTGIGKVGEVLFTLGEALAAPLLSVQSVVVANPDGTALPMHIEQVELSQQTYLPLIVQE